MNMVIARIIGGLGNQMFQYAAGRALADVNGCQLKLDVSGFDGYGVHNGYELNHFRIRASIASELEIRRLAGQQSRLARFFRRKTGFAKKTHFLERDFSFDASFFSLEPPVYLDGYWQSYKYSEAILAQIREELTPLSPLAGKNIEAVNAISGVNSVSLHVRRGDYITNPRASRVHGFVGVEYYKEAILRVCDQVQSPRFFVFSDDISWVRENLDLADDAVFIEHNSGPLAFEDMRLMSLCKHNIIANSTFSWWAAWIGNCPGKLVFYPKNWFVGDKQNTSSLWPVEWFQIGKKSLK